MDKSSTSKVKLPYAFGHSQLSMAHQRLYLQEQLRLLDVSTIESINITLLWTLCINSVKVIIALKNSLYLQKVVRGHVKVFVYTTSTSLVSPL